MNNLSYWLARIYYKLVGITVDPIPTTFKAEYWAERIYRFIAGLPVGITDGKPIQFWFELWFYHVTGQSHRLATGTQSAWFWLSKLYAHYAGLSLDGVLVPASDEFWASKLLEVVSSDSGSPEISVSVNGIAQADNSTFTPADPVIGTVVQYVVEVTNNGDAQLDIVNATRSGAVSAVTAWSDTTIAPLGTATCTITLDTATSGAQTGYFEFTTNDLDDGEDTYRVNVAYDVLAPEMRVVIDAGEVADGGTYAAGTVNANASLQKTVTIHNDGTSDLTVTSPPSVTGDVTAGAISSTTIVPSASATFTLTCTTSSTGARSGTVSIASDDPNENPYNWTVNFTVRTYTEKSLTLGTPKQLLIGNETSGATAEDATAENNDGSYSGVTINSAASPVSGDNAPLWDGANDTLNAFSAALASDFNGGEFTISTWVKVSAAGVWTDGTQRHLLQWRGASDNNRLYISKRTANNTIEFVYVAGGTNKTVAHTISTTNWFHVALVVSKTGDYMKCFVDGVQTGATQTGLGTFGDALASARYGSNFGATSAYWSGYLYHMRYGVSPLSDADVAKLAVVP